MIGHNVISEFIERCDHLTTIKAKTDGLIAVLPLNELKIEVRRAPEAVSSQNLIIIGVQSDTGGG